MDGPGNEIRHGTYTCCEIPFNNVDWGKRDKSLCHLPLHPVPLNSLYNYLVFQGSSYFRERVMYKQSFLQNLSTFKHEERHMSWKWAFGTCRYIGGAENCDGG